VGGIPEHSSSGVPPPLTPPHKGEGDPGTSTDRLDVALATFGVEALRDIPAGYLSAGQRRRAGLMRLALAQRPIWLLDEPTASLDQAGQEVLAVAVNAHLAGGGLVVAATHMPLTFDRARELRLGPAGAAA
jgi:heme exporter protein A